MLKTCIKGNAMRTVEFKSDLESRVKTCSSSKIIRFLDWLLNTYGWSALHVRRHSSRRTRNQDCKRLSVHDAAFDFFPEWLKCIMVFSKDFPQIDFGSTWSCRFNNNGYIKRTFSLLQTLSYIVSTPQIQSICRRLPTLNTEIQSECLWVFEKSASVLSRVQVENFGYSHFRPACEVGEMRGPAYYARCAMIVSM